MTLKYKNGTIHYTDTGEGQPIIFLHGFLENSTMWNQLIKGIPMGFRCICIDLPGHGLTDNFGYVHTMEDMAHMAYSVLNSLNIKSACVVGHSMGGYVALALAELSPKLINGVCLMNSTFEADDKDRKLLRERAISMAQQNYEQLVRMSFANLFAAESKLKFKNDFENALSEALKTSVQGYIAAQKGMILRKNRLYLMKNLKTKKLIIVGKKDPVISANQIQKSIIGTDIQCVELSEGHMSHIENKSELSYFILRFIE